MDGPDGVYAGHPGSLAPSDGDPVTDHQNLAYYEQVAAAQARNLQLQPISWNEILAVGQASMAHLQTIAEERGEIPHREVLAAARLLDSTSRHSTALPPEHRRGIALLAAVAYGMDGNTPCATAMAREAGRLGPALTSIEMAAIGTVAPALIGQFLTQELSNTSRDYIEQLNYYLDTGDSHTAILLRDLLARLFQDAPQPLESVLLGASIQALPVVVSLSVASRFPPSDATLLGQYVSAAIRQGIRTFLPAQRDALDRCDILGSSNLVIALPTSTGKTLLSELALIAGLESGPGLCCYVAPYVALGRQVAQVIRSRAPTGVRVHPLIGGYRLPDHIDADTQRELVVATPERFDALLRSDANLRARIRCIVIDEAHSLANGDRGVRVEGLISRLRILQERGHPLRLITLSAVVSNPHDLVRWLGADRTELAASAWRPTARRTIFWASDGRLLMLVGDDEVRAAGQNAQSTIGAQVLRWPQPSLYPPRNFGQVRVQQSGVLDNVAYLVDYLLARNEGPVLCVCSSKAETRGLAAAVAARLGPVSALTPGLGRIVSRVQSRRPFLRSLSEDVQCGVAYHNAGVPGDVRELIEAGVRDSEIRVVTATTTLAEGVDLPFRFTVLVDWLVWSDGHQKPMDPLLFRNIAGRSGRAGVYTEGDTYIFDNVVGAYEYTNTQVRRRFQTEVFASDSLPPLRSTLTEEGDGLSRAGEAILASQLLAAIPESGAVDDLSSVFADRSYAGATGSASALLQRLRHIESDITDRELGALATAASPLQLTDFGRAGNLTGMSPGACRRVVAVVPGIMGLNGVGALGATLVRDLADIPEQTNAALRKRLLGGSSRYLVASEDLEPVLNGWVSGAGEEELFLELGYVARSSRRPKAREWLELGTVSHTWHEEFDKFLEFLEGCVIGFLPWVLTACAILQPFSSPASGAAVEWELLSGMFETGTDSEWAVRAVRAGAPGSRMSIAKVGRSWPADMEFPEGRRLRGVMREQRVERVSGVFRAVRSSLSGERKGEELGAELEQLQAWVVDRL